MLVRSEPLTNLSSHVSTTLRALMKGVQADGELDEAALYDAVCHLCIFQ